MGASARCGGRRLSTLGPDRPFPADAFTDVLAGNAAFAAGFGDADLEAGAARHLAVVTCIDSRIDALAVIGVHAGDAMVVRNAGARVTDDVLRTLVLATTVLGVDRILVMPHTRCKMASVEESALHAAILRQHGIDTRSLEFRTVADQEAALRDDVTRVRSSPFLRPEVVVGGAVYDVTSGRLLPVDA